jgi:hypothetical protein
MIIMILSFSTDPECLCGTDIRQGEVFFVNVTATELVIVALRVGCSNFWVSFVMGYQPGELDNLVDTTKISSRASFRIL